MAHDRREAVRSISLLAVLLACELVELPAWAEGDGDPAGSRSGGALETAAAPTPGRAIILAPGREVAEASEPGWRPQLGLYFTSAVPMGAFGNRVDDPGLGLSLVAGIGLPRLPIVLGGQVSFMDYGRDTRREIVSTSVGSVEGRLTTTNEIIAGHLLLRAQPISGWIRPYVEGVFGFNQFSTHSRVSVPGFDPNDPSASDTIASKTNLEDTALSYGPGAGLDLRLWASENGGGSLRVNVGARYLFGGRARYLKESSIRRQGDQVFGDVLESRTDMLVAQLGLFMEF